MTWQIPEGYTINFNNDDPSGVLTDLSDDIEFDSCLLSGIAGTYLNIYQEAFGVDYGKVINMGTIMGEVLLVVS